MRNPCRAAAVAVGVACLGLYLATLSRCCWVGDSGELAADAAILGIPHPPGYPLYTLLGRTLLTFAPLKPAIALNLLSAVASAFAATLVGVMIMRLGGGWAAVAAGGLLCGTARTIWMHSAITEVYTLHLMLAVLAFLLAVRSHQDRSFRYALAASWIAGLGLAHHTSMVLLLPALGVLIGIWGRSRRQRLARTVLCSAMVVLALTAYLYLPIRSRLDPVNDWGNPEALRSLWNHVSGRLYAREMGALGAISARVNLEMLGRFVLQQWTPVVLVLPLVGLVLTAAKHRKRFLVLTLAAIPVLGFGLTYRIPDIEPQFAPLAIIGTLAAVPVLRRLEDTRWGRMLLPAVVAIPLFYNWSVVRSAVCAFPENYARAVLEAAPPGATVICRGQLTPLLAYLHQAEDARPDLRLVDQLGNLFVDPYGYGAATEPPARHRRKIERGLLEREGRLFYVLRPEAPFTITSCGLLFRALPSDAEVSPCALSPARPPEDPREGCLREPIVEELAVHYHLHMALWASENGDRQVAEEHLAACRKLSGRSPQALTALADYYREQQAPKKAAPLYREALGIDRHYLPAALGLVEISPAEAPYLLNGATRRYAGDGEALCAAAEGWLNAGKPRQAEDLARQALELMPANCHAALVLGNSLVDQGELSEAEDVYERALAGCPDLADAWINLCLVYGSTDRMEQAVESGERAVALAPADPAALNNLGTTYARLGRFDEAKDLWRRSLAIDPTQDRIREYLESATRG